MSETFYCEECKQTFDKGTDFTKDAQNDEFNQNFGRDISNDDASVCEDCFKKIMNHCHDGSWVNLGEADTSKGLCLTCGGEKMTYYGHEVKCADCEDDA